MVSWSNFFKIKSPLSDQDVQNIVNVPFCNLTPLIRKSLQTWYQASQGTQSTENLAILYDAANPEKKVTDFCRPAAEFSEQQSSQTITQVSLVAQPPERQPPTLQIKPLAPLLPCVASHQSQRIVTALELISAYRKLKEATKSAQVVEQIISTLQKHRKQNSKIANDEAKIIINEFPNIFILFVIAHSTYAEIKAELPLLCSELHRLFAPYGVFNKTFWEDRSLTDRLLYLGVLLLKEHPNHKRTVLDLDIGQTYAYNTWTPSITEILPQEYGLLISIITPETVPPHWQSTFSGDPTKEQDQKGWFCSIIKNNFVEIKDKNLELYSIAELQAKLNKLSHFFQSPLSQNHLGYNPKPRYLVLIKNSLVTEQVTSITEQLLRLGCLIVYCDNDQEDDVQAKIRAYQAKGFTYANSEWNVRPYTAAELALSLEILWTKILSLLSKAVPATATASGTLIYSSNKIPHDFMPPSFKTAEGFRNFEIATQHEWLQQRLILLQEVEQSPSLASSVTAVAVTGEAAVAAPILKTRYYLPIPKAFASHDALLRLVNSPQFTALSCSLILFDQSPDEIDKEILYREENGSVPLNAYWESMYPTNLEELFFNINMTLQQIDQAAPEQQAIQQMVQSAPTLPVKATRQEEVIESNNNFEFFRAHLSPILPICLVDGLFFKNYLIDTPDKLANQKGKFINFEQLDAEHGKKLFAAIKHSLKNITEMANQAINLLRSQNKQPSTTQQPISNADYLILWYAVFFPDNSPHKNIDDNMRKIDGILQKCELKLAPTSAESFKPNGP